MYTKEDCLKVIDKLIQKTGFPLPENKFNYTADKLANKRENFDDKTKELNIMVINDERIPSLESEGMATFDIAHEYGHAVFDFVIKNHLYAETIYNLSLEEYNNLLQKHYQDATIQADENMLNDLKGFVSASQWFTQDIRDILIFEDKNYVLGNGMTKNEYANSPLEIYANQFAAEQTIASGAYAHQPEEFLHGLAYEAFLGSILINEKYFEKSEETFNKQIAKPEKTFFEKLKDKILKKEPEPAPRYLSFNFTGFANKMRSSILGTMSMISTYANEHPTKEEREAREKIEKEKRDARETLKERVEELKREGKKIDIIKDYNPQSYNDHRYHLYEKTPQELDARLNWLLQNDMIKEIILDTNNDKLYAFYLPRIEEINQEYGNDVLEENTQNQEKQEQDNGEKTSNKNQQINNREDDGNR